jgi:hypothetical protein
MKCAFSSAAGVRTLDELHAERPITTVIHGGATGADTMLCVRAFFQIYPW